jgi:hypothetical protein
MLSNKKLPRHFANQWSLLCLSEGFMPAAVAVAVAVGLHQQRHL